MTWLLQLLGARVAEGSRLTEMALSMRPVAEPVLLGAVAVGLVGLAIWAYRRVGETASGWSRHVLVALRVVLLLLLVLLLARPTLVVTVQSRVRRLLVLLLDGSASMGIQDGQASRLEKVRGALQRDDYQLQRLAHDYDVVPFQFGQDLQELTSTNGADWISQLTTNSVVSPIGDAVRELLRRKRGQPLAGIVLVTDGANNAGSSPREMALLAGEEAVPLYIHGVGRQAPKDVIVSSIFVQDLAFVADEVPVTVRVRGQGMAGRTARISLKAGDQVVEQQTVSFPTDAEQVVTLLYKPRDKGEVDLTAVIEPFADELVKDNNSRSQRLRVIDAKIKVLLVEQAPRWEWHYLQAMLLRDKRVELRCVLVEGDPGIASGENSPYLEQFPKDKEALLGYDLVILGDVDPRALSPEQVELLGRFVSDFGGALVMVAGKRFNPHAYRRSALERLLPVELDGAASDSPLEPAANTPIKLELTTEGQRNNMLKLADTAEENLARWSRLPPLYWTSRVSRAKPGAEVLLVDADPARLNRAAKMPVLATHQYGMGHVLFLGTDNIWRWRKNVGDTYYVRFWGQIVQRMALTHLLGGAKRTQLSASRQNYNRGDRVTVYARLYTSSFTPVTEERVRGYYVNRSATSPGANAAAEVWLRPVPAQPGVYRGEFVAPEAGHYKFHLERDQDTQLDFSVQPPQFEMGDTAMNEELLREMARLSGGAFLGDRELRQLPSLVNRKSDTITATQEVELWASPIYLLLVVLVAAAEWSLRKWNHLK